MLEICPKGAPPTSLCATCQWRGKCAIAPKEQAVVINGLFGVWTDGNGKLAVGDGNGQLPLEMNHLDALVALLQAAQQELSGEALLYKGPLYLKISSEMAGAY